MKDHKQADAREHKRHDEPQRLREMLRRDWDGPGLRQFERKPTEDGQVGVEPDALDPADAEDRQTIVVLQPPKLALDG